SAPGGGLVMTDLSDINRPDFSILSLKANTCSLCDPHWIVGDKYLRLAGTSMAAPHASGVAALVLACNPTFTNVDVRHVLQASARFRMPDGRIGFRQVNSFGALAYTTIPTTLLTRPLRLATYSTTAGAVQITGTV